MSFSLFPKSVKFFDLFQEQNRKTFKAATILDEIMQHFQDVEEKCKQINIIEAEGNAISRNISHELSTTFITPIDREDIHEINLTQEAILNLVKAISTRIGLYDFPRVKYPAKKLCANLKLMVEEAGMMLRGLAGRKEVEAHLERIKAFKYECEMILLVALGETFDNEGLGNAPIMDVIKWTHIYDRIEQAIERAEALADVLEGISLKNA
jgi:uncharacterized protein Yka (UPF0111/DUF47 family)